MNKDIVTILCSGVALGVYIPALLTNYQLKSAGINTDVQVLENLLHIDKKSKLLDNKKAFHKNFRLALAGQKMARDLWPSFDKTILNTLFNNWDKEGRKDFIIFSGFWMSVINEYSKTIHPEKLNIDIIHMDADISVSWKHFKNESEKYNNIWLFSWNDKNLIYEITVPGSDIIPFKERENRFVIHGGGWGMGTYQSKIPELINNNINLDIVAYDMQETKQNSNNNRIFMIDPEWAPWIKNENNLHEFPPFGEINIHADNKFINRDEYHELFDVIKKSRGIISKPGGATLLDSLASATPVIMLDPFGEYENKNSLLWKHLGFGIYYDEWEKMNYSMNILEKLHENLLAKKGNQIDYIKDFVRRSKNKHIVKAC